MKPLKITIIGSSVAMRIRPREHREAKNYGQLLETRNPEQVSDRVVMTENLSFSRALITEIDHRLDEFIRSFPDLYVINIGAVDAPTREIPVWFSNIIFKRKLPSLYRPSTFVYRNLVARWLRRPLVVVRGFRSWVPQKRYLDSMKRVIVGLKQETGATVVVLGINPGNDRIERQLPGTTKRYREYSSRLADLCEATGTPFVDVSDLSSSDHFPDGVHYNQAGHELIADRIWKAYERAGF